MRGLPSLVLAPLLAMLGGCQAIAGLDVPTYARRATGAGTGGSDSGGAGGSGGVGTGGEGGRAMTGGGGACTFPTTGETPPCPEHIQLWLRGDARGDLSGPGDELTTWHDASSFGWTAKTAPGETLATADDVLGHRAVRLGKQSLTLDPHGKLLPLAQVGVFSALKFESFPEQTGDNNFRSNTLLCLASTLYEQRLEYTFSDSGLGPRFSMLVSDEVQSNPVTMTEPGPKTEGWHIYISQFACDRDTCAPTGAGLQEEAIVDMVSVTNHDTHSPSLAAEPSNGWSGAWATANLGSSCEPTRFPIDAFVGEIILYDQFLDETSRNLVYGYLANRWGG